MDVFALRESVVEEYRDYFQSFVTIFDERVADFVRQRLASGDLWPDATLQLNPAFAYGPTLAELAAAGALTPQTARFFGPQIRLYRHQAEALEIARRGEPYVVSTGTGSGKSLTYLLPIADAVFRDRPERHTVRAVIVYPMNALINSQIRALEAFRDRNWPDAPLRFAAYTGQTTEEERQRILDDPPHVLLTNYVMLEYLMIRPWERPLLEQATRDLRFLVLDELHVYGGRQGADVAMLVRRVRQRAGGAVQLIGTSATIATGGDRRERRQAIAAVGSTLFGVPVPEANVVEETLRRVATRPAPRTRDELRAAVLAEPPEPAPEAVAAHPLAAWVEETFGLEEREGRLVRRAPVTFQVGLRWLVEASGLDEQLCRERLGALLAAASAARGPTGEPVLAFRLHQFLSSGGSVFATLEPPQTRTLTTEGQVVAQRADGGEEKLYYPLAFCRECGQEYYLVELFEDGGLATASPRSPFTAFAADQLGEPGYLAIDDGALWSGDEELPDSWLEWRATGPRVRREYERHVPRRFWAWPDGRLVAGEADGALPVWFQPAPFLLCLRCRAAYDRRERNDFAKLSTLSQVGRSTATTTVTLAAVTELRRGGVEPASAKVLSFTDNRQDASLQAGHLNDFVQMALLRGAIVRALATEGELAFERLGEAVFRALDLPGEQFMREAVGSGPGYQSARQAMVRLLEYRAFEDLRRAWRVAQPNLEQCGLLRIGYAGLDDLASDDDLWRALPAIGEASPARRRQVLDAVLDHLRSELVIDADCLRQERIDELRRLAGQWLRDPWSLDEFEWLPTAKVAVLPGAVPPEDVDTIALSARSALGRYLRSRRTWGLPVDLTGPEVEALVHGIVARLRGHLLVVLEREGEPYGVQLRAAALRWLPGDGRAPGPDPVRARALHLRKAEHRRAEPNRYFARLYQERARDLAGITAREHTGQVPREERIDRERRFQAGELPALFCSPTMELGIDIADLAVVHMRNVPPTPANYAQRSGRAGRGGRPALVLTFCTHGNAHDQYFFRRRERMIAGAVAPARIDLTNRRLLEAHLHSVWLAETGVSLGRSMAELLDLDDPAYPLLPEKRAQIELSPERQERVVRAFQQVLGSVPASEGLGWLTESWIREVVASAPRALDAACDRWRELYTAAVRQRDDARRVIDRPRVSREQREEAERREREAKREIELLLNEGETEESDFYPYRYLASEGFLPGYNFPALPLRALVTVGDRTQAIQRPRFLGLTEFGPHNIIYHEGRKFHVTGCVVPAGGIESRLTRAKICEVCGYIYPGDEARVDVCRLCGTLLDGATSQYPQYLFEQPAVRTRRRERITADEEERTRHGYRVTTHFRLPPGETLQRSQARRPDGEALLEIQFAQAAELWRINHGWRRTPQREGFTLDTTTGQWGREGENAASAARDPAVIHGVKPYVTDTLNVLLVRPVSAALPQQRREEFLATLAIALQRGIQVIYQVEEEEIAVELIGRDEHRQILLWENAEGGTGVWERLLGDPSSLAQVAVEALRICHIDPQTGQDEPGWPERCVAACYDCLLSYSNQLLHRQIDRQLVRDFLRELAAARLEPFVAGRDREGQYRWLLERADSELERAFLEYLYQSGLRLPDHAQYQPGAVNVQVDFYYERQGVPGVCVFVDGPAHDEPGQAAHDRRVREELEDLGYRVAVVRYDRPFAEQLRVHADVFGS